jgi:hypothetical protein
MRATVLLIVLIVVGCTPYQDIGLMGGVEAQQVTATTFRIVARGNGYTSNTRIQDYALLKAAETTKAAGGTHFAIVSAEDATVQQSLYLTQIGPRGSAFTTASIGSVAKPGQDTYIRVFALDPGQAAPQGTLLADEIIQFVGPRVKGEKGSWLL